MGKLPVAGASLLSAVAVYQGESRERAALSPAIKLQKEDEHQPRNAAIRCIEGRRCVVAGCCEWEANKKTGVTGRGGDCPTFGQQQRTDEHAKALAR